MNASGDYPQHHKVEAEPDADDSLQSDYFDSTTKTHLRCQHSAAQALGQPWLCAGAEIWYLGKFLHLLLRFAPMSLILPEYCIQVFVGAVN